MMDSALQSFVQLHPDEAAALINHGVTQGKEHSEPSPATVEMFKALAAEIKSIKLSLESHIKNVCARSDSDQKRDAFIDRLMAEEMQETIAFEFLKNKAKKANGWLATFMDFSKSAATMGAILYAIWHFLVSNLIK